MAIKGINIYETRDYISRYDPEKDGDKATVFTIGLLDKQISNYIKDRSAQYEYVASNPDGEAALSVRPHERNLDIFRFGVRDIKNLIDPQTEKPVRFDTTSISRFGKNYNVVSDSILQMIPDCIIDEIAAEIDKINKLSPEERKN